MPEPTTPTLADRALAQSKHMRFCLEKSRPGGEAVSDLTDLLDTLAKVERLEAENAALRGYCVHDENCEVNHWPPGLACTCGLSAALKGRP